MPTLMLLGGFAGVRNIDHIIQGMIDGTLQVLHSLGSRDLIFDLASIP